MLQTFLTRSHLTFRRGDRPCCRSPRHDASDKHVSRVSSLSLVRYRTNDYSVPVAYGHMEVLVRGYVGEVVISNGAEVIARHPRSYERDDFVFDPIHYLPLLEPGRIAPVEWCARGRRGPAWCDSLAACF